MNMISVIIITKNEEKNIKRCLEGVLWADEIIIVDDESMDKTVEIAKNYDKTKVYIKKMEGFGEQKNFALSKASAEWVLNIDADEVVIPKLMQEILEKIENETKYSGYYLRRNNFVFGKFWLDYKPAALRLFKREKGKFTDMKVHEHVVVDGEVGFIKTPLLHYSNALSNVKDYVEIYLNNYTTKAVFDLKKKGVKIKKSNLIYYFVVKPFLIFIQKYFFKQYFKRGIRGLFLAQFVAIAYLVSYIKLWEDQEKISK
ncbi:MAG: glycosyltransferase family 2 protein [Endomicrobiia bacterium]